MTQNGSLRNPTSNIHTFRTNVIDADILASIHTITTYPLIGNTSYTIVIKFFYENIMVNRIKSLFLGP